MEYYEAVKKKDVDPIPSYCHENASKIYCWVKKKKNY